MQRYVNNTAFIILNYNDYEATFNCFKNLKQLNNNFKIIIVDNNSTLECREKLKKLKEFNNTHVIFNKKNLGYAAGNNVGLKYIICNIKEVEVAFILNPDIYIKKLDYIKKLYNTLLLDDELAVITAMTIYNNKLIFPNYSCWRRLNKNQIIINSSLIGKVFKKNIYYKCLTLKNELAYVDVVQGCFFGIKLDCIEKIDFLDERTFLYCEEQILSYKLKNIGKKSGVLIDTYIHHNHIKKDKSLQNKKTKIFHLKCLMNSRIIIVKNYMDLKPFQQKIRCCFLKIDFFLKRIFVSFGL